VDAVGDANAVIGIASECQTGYVIYDSFNSPDSIEVPQFVLGHSPLAALDLEKQRFAVRVQ
jgi:hypothetical protein